MRNKVLLHGVFLALFIELFYSSLAYAKHECHDHILKSTCLIQNEYKFSAQKSYIENIKDRDHMKCLKGTDKYAQELHDLFPSLPNHTKDAFCHIRKIFIVIETPGYGASARKSYSYEDYQIDQKNQKIGLRPNGFYLYISKAGRFDLKENHLEYKNRILQKYFGSDLLKGEKNDELPEFKRISKEPQVSNLYKTIVHEVGHFLDFSNNLTHITAYSTPWINFDWDGEEFRGRVRTLRPKVGFNPVKSTQHSYDPKNWRKIMKELHNSSFTSLYSLTNPTESFAELYTHIVLAEDFEIVDQGEVIFSTQNKRSKVFAQKIQYMKDIMKYTKFSDIHRAPMEWRRLY